ncbi:MAG: hypothetical protein D6715_02495 [Calditrichaeota bacterium]|nr:MAG: hypothetical protein D6715_02495 [Calditrichota bacterium]
MSRLPFQCGVARQDIPWRVFFIPLKSLSIRVDPRPIIFDHELMRKNHFRQGLPFILALGDFFITNFVEVALL